MGPQDPRVLVLRSKTRTSLFLLCDEFVDVAPTPRLSGLERSNDGMMGRFEVFRGVFILGVVAATYLPASEAEP